MRMLTTTVKTADGKLVPVRTDRAVPKELLPDVMKLCRKQAAPEECKAGDVVIADILGCGVNITAERVDHSE